MQGNTDVWLLDGVRTSRLTFDAAVDSYPVWSPDGSRIVFSSNRTGQSTSTRCSRSGGSGGAAHRGLRPGQDSLQLVCGRPQPVVSAASNRKGTSISGSCRWWANRTPWAFLKTPFREAYGVFSPDGRWVAYQSNESGRPEVYVRPVCPARRRGHGRRGGGQWQVSTAGGVFPAWRPDGKELYYLNPAGAMMAASITVTGATLAPGAPVVLFPTRISGGGVDRQQGRQYDVGPDGRFLINTELPGAAAPITLIQQWKREVKE